MAEAKIIENPVGAIIRVYSTKRGLLVALREGFAEMHDEMPSVIPIKPAGPDDFVWVMEHTRHGNLDVLGWLATASRDIEDIGVDLAYKDSLDSITISVEIQRERADAE